MIVASDPRPFSFSELGQVPTHATRRQAMKVDKTSAALPSASTVASQSAQHSSRISPYSSSTTTVTSLPATTSASVTSLTAASSVSSAGTFGTMATPAFLPYPHAFRSAMPTSGSYSSSRFFDREAPKPVGTPYSNSPSAVVPVLIRRLPINTSEESLRLMVVWSQELADVKLLSLSKSEDTGFRSAILTFRTLAGAHEAKRMLDGRSNISNDAEMVVEILSSSVDSSRRYSPDTVSADPPSSASSASSGTGSHQPSRFNGAFQSLESTSPSSNSAFPGSELSFTDSSARFQNSFSPHSPLNNYLLDPQRISGKSLIANDSTDDDETSDLINDPIAYAENSSISQRRATAPQIPIGRMAGLSLNTNNPTPTGPSSMPPYMSPMSAHPLSPMNGSSPVVPYPMGNPPYRNNFPPVNPADQNPPCNTLYVGNLPVDTSEEELKAMFSKQRGYRRLCFRTKQNGPMCFVEFEDVSFATKALRDLYGHPLHNSVKGGIRLSFSKNPLGVRSGQAPSQNNAAALGAMSGMMPGPPAGFATTNGPPPGLTAPPGFASGRGNYPSSSSMNTSHGQPYTPSAMNTGHGNPYAVVGFPGMTTSAWNGPMFGASNSPATNFPPPHLMRR